MDFNDNSIHNTKFKEYYQSGKKQAKVANITSILPLRCMTLDSLNDGAVLYIYSFYS